MVRLRLIYQTRSDEDRGYYYADYREQSPNLGRFFSPDPVSGDISNPQSLNRYAYVLNNPTSLIDPLGLRCIRNGHDQTGEFGSQSSCEEGGGRWTGDDSMSDAVGSGPGGGAGCSISIGLVTLHIAGCNFGDTGHGGSRGSISGERPQPADNPKDINNSWS